jgi:hypothetical protein
MKRMRPTWRGLSKIRRPLSSKKYLFSHVVSQGGVDPKKTPEFEPQKQGYSREER